MNGCVQMVENLHEYAAPKSVDKPIMFLGDTCEIRQVPLGVVLIISAWNYPIQLTMLPLIGAIAGGNSVVIKMSEIAPHSAILMSRLIPKYLDPGCYSVVLGAIPESTILLEQNFDFICYTGNTHVGKIVHQAAAKNLTPVLLELGGKCPCIVDDTIDPAIAAKRIAWGKIGNSGQTCIAPDYVLVDKKVSKQFLLELEKSFRGLLNGSAEKAAHYGRIVSEKHFNRLTGILASELKVKGSTKYYGGASRRDDYFIEPTIVTLEDSDVSKHPILQEEIFGPLLPVIEFNNIDEAIRIVKKMCSFLM
jgi:acyl-CoA reductase-like NAD-dependent aldehyde dehydrogenase